MRFAEKDAVYRHQNSYSTLNHLTPKTKNVWLVNHGIGFLSKYFIQYFNALDAEENYIIAPQAPSKYYLGNEYKHVGACWLTRENTEVDIENVLNYLDAVYTAEAIPYHVNFIVLGFSQGVSVTTRWVARRKIRCDKMILFAGGIPTELQPEDFNFLHRQGTKVTCIYGDKDPYIEKNKLLEETKRMKKLFGDLLTIETFAGGHEFRSDFLPSWI
ncbi:alpha/beta hydrolase [Flavobacteriaceae bacterium M23B6Z8]